MPHENLSGKYYDYAHDVIAGWDIAGKYKQMKEAAQYFEKERPRLLKRLGVDPDHFHMPSLDQLNILTDSDRIIADKYLKMKLNMDIMDVTIAERLSDTDMKIIKSICTNGWTNRRAAQETGFSPATVQRARDHAKQAFADEAQCRFAVGEVDLKDNPWGINFVSSYNR